MLLDTPLKTKTFPFEASAKWYDFGNDNLTFFSRKPVAFWVHSAGWQILDRRPAIEGRHQGKICRMAKSL